MPGYGYIQSRIPELLLAQGNSAARAAENSGNIWARLSESLGQIAGGALQQHQEQQGIQKQQALQRDQTTQVEGALTKAQTPDADPSAIEASLDPSLRGKFRESWGRIEDSAGKRRKVRQEAQAADLDYMGDLAAEVEGYASGPDGGLSAAKIAIAHAKKEGLKGAEQFEQILAEDPTKLGAIIQAAKQASPKWQKIGQEKAKGEREAADLTLRQTREQRELEAAKGLAADRVADNTRGEQTLAETIRHNRQQEVREPKEGGKMWVSRNGKLVRISEAEYQPGDQPASTREQGRPVIPGQAEDLSDFDTALDDVKVVRDRLAKPGSTGNTARAGAAIPDVITDVTGWGADAKSRQATIDRVKQVIGKTLEGGVLRKEDELKYEKILPTIRDSQEVVKSKLDGLDAAIKKRKERRLDALEDSGFDVSKFRARKPVSDAAVPGKTAMTWGVEPVK